MKIRAVLATKGITSLPSSELAQAPVPETMIFPDDASLLGRKLKKSNGGF